MRKQNVQYKNSKFKRVKQKDIVSTLETLHGIGQDTAQDVVALVDARKYEDLLNDDRTDLKVNVKRELLTSQINRESVFAVLLYQAQKNDGEEVNLYKKGDSI
jgi:ribosomal protein S13